MPATAALRSLLLLALTSACVACGGGPGDIDTDVTVTHDGSGGVPSAPKCTSFHDYHATVTTTVDAGCAGCSVTAKDEAADGDASTAAVMTVNNAAPAMGAAIRATAQNGVTIPAGSMAGASYSVPAATTQTYYVSFRTYLAGRLQEQDDGATSPSTNSGAGGQGAAFNGIRTTKAFDAVELFINNTQTGGTPAFDVYEMCANYAN